MATQGENAMEFVNNFSRPVAGARENFPAKNQRMRTMRSRLT